MPACSQLFLLKLTEKRFVFFLFGLFRNLRPVPAHITAFVTAPLAEITVRAGVFLCFTLLFFGLRLFHAFILSPVCASA